MAGDWGILNGDPAPGSLDSVDQVVRDFDHVAKRTAEAAVTLRRIGGEAGIQSWKGTASAAFRDHLGKVPSQLDKAAGSYDAAVRALRTYREFLAQAQQRANALRALANQAASDEATAEQRLRDAKARLNSLVEQRRTTLANVTQLKLRIAVTTDAAAKTQLQTELTRLQATVRRQDADISAARAEVTRRERERDDARRRLDSARRQAGQLAEETRRAADTAVRQLQGAEQQAQLPNAAERAWTEAREMLVEYGPVLVDTLRLGSTLFSIAAAVFPVGAPIFLAASLICGGAGLLLNLAVTANSPGGFTSAKLWELGGQALGVLATAAGLGAVKAAAAGASSASWLGGTAKVLNWGQSGAELGKDYATGGVAGLISGAGTLLLAKGTSYVGGKVLQAGVGGLNHVPLVKDRIKSLSVAVRQEPGPFGTTLTTTTIRDQQALLAGSHIPPGGFTYGNTGSSNPLDHRLGQKATSALFEDSVKDAVDLTLEKLGVEEGITSFIQTAPSTPEIDINLPQK